LKVPWSILIDLRPNADTGGMVVPPFPRQAARNSAALIIHHTPQIAIA
jgi:hypothetical protein